MNQDGFINFQKELLFTGVLFSGLIHDTGLSAVTCCTSYTVHGATETNGRTRLVFFHEAAGTGSEPVGAVVPATTFDNPDLIADQRCFSITISHTGDQGVTIEVVDNITFLVVSPGFTFLVSYMRDI